MKKIVKLSVISMIIAVASMFAGCTETQQLPPKVEIVERSDLLKRMDMSYILSRGKVQKLSGKGLNVSFRNFMLTSDNQASFDLLLENKQGKKITLPMNAMLDYNHTVENGRDVFTDIQLFWGDVDVYGDSIVVTNMSQPIRFSLTDMDMKWEKYDTAFLDGGYIVDNVQTGENMAFLYYTDNEEGIAVFDADSNLVSRTAFAKSPGTSNLADVTGDVFIPAQLQKSAHLYETSGTLYTEGLSHSYIYDYNRKILYTGNSTVWKNAASGEIEYKTFRFENPRITNRPYIYMATAEKSGKLYERQTFTIPVAVNSSDVVMSVNENGQPLLSCADTGVMVTMDFENDTVYTQFNITEEMLTEKLYTSKDKNYELYSYAHKSSDIPAYHIVLKETSTGALRYIDEIGIMNGYYEGETGFVNNEYIYLLTGDNLKIYNTDMSSVSHILALADFFPLGVISDSYDTRHLISAAAVDSDHFAVVYYEDNLMAGDEDRFADIQNKTTLNSVYKVGLFDGEGNLTATYDTGINVICGWCPVHSYIKGDDISITVTYKDTDHIFTKGTLNLTDGAFTLVKDYTAPDKW